MMTIKNFNLPEFLTELGVALQRDSGMRKGQVFYHTLNGMCPEMANALRRAEMSPFHDDTKVSEALQWVYNNTPEYRESD